MAVHTSSLTAGLYSSHPVFAFQPAKFWACPSPSVFGLAFCMPSAGCWGCWKMPCHLLRDPIALPSQLHGSICCVLPSWALESSLWQLLGWHGFYWCTATRVRYFTAHHLLHWAAYCTCGVHAIHCRAKAYQYMCAEEFYT